MKETIVYALAEIQALPYKTGKDFEYDCLNVFIRHFLLNRIILVNNRADFNVTKGATFYSKSEDCDGVTIIFQPNGSQASPDIRICVHKKTVLDIECKANENAAQPNWNQHVPYQDVLYLWASKKRDQVTIRAGWQLIGPAEEVAVRAFYKKMKDLAKSFEGPLNQSSLDVALRYNLNHNRRNLVFAEDLNLQIEALDWACKLFK